MKNQLVITSLLFLTAIATANAGEVNYNLEGHFQGLYGYTDVKKNNHGVGQGNISSSLSYAFDEQTSATLHLDLMGGIDQEIQDYNQGRWGEEVYGELNSRYGQVMLGQVYNVASLFHDGTPATGALSSNNDVADFLHNPSWKRNKKETYFTTLNSSDINTDGVAPKINYITPEFYGTGIGFSYMPDSYNRRGLVNKHANYAHDDGFVGAVYNDYDWGAINSQASIGYAQYHGNDKEFSYSLKLSRGNWSLGGGYRKTYTDGDNKISQNANLPQDFDAYREGQAWNIGLGYEIGPFSTSLSYFESKASHLPDKSKVTVFSNQYQINKNFDVYVAAAYGDYTTANERKNGYAVVSGVGVNF